MSVSRRSLPPPRDVQFVHPRIAYCVSRVLPVPHPRIAPKVSLSDADDATQAPYCYE